MFLVPKIPQFHFTPHTPLSSFVLPSGLDRRRGVLKTQLAPYFPSQDFLYFPEEKNRAGRERQLAEAVVEGSGVSPIYLAGAFGRMQTSHQQSSIPAAKNCATR